MALVIKVFMNPIFLLWMMVRKSVKVLLSVGFLSIHLMRYAPVLLSDNHCIKKRKEMAILHLHCEFNGVRLFVKVIHKFFELLFSMCPNEESVIHIP